MGVVQLLVDAVFDNVLQDRGPARHLIGLLRDALFLADGPHLLAISL